MARLRRPVATARAAAAALVVASALSAAPASAQAPAAVQAQAAPPASAALVDQWRPVLVSRAEKQEDRLRLKWQTRAPSPGQETLEVWDVDPTRGDGPAAWDPVFSQQVSSDLVERLDAPDGRRDVRIRNFLGFRQMWWSVAATAPTGELAWSEVRSVRVVPSPLNRSEARVSPKYTPGYSSKRPGTIRLRITSSPRARVTLTVRHGGRTVTQRRYVEGVGKIRGFDFRQSCRQTGRFDYTVRIRDPYGASVTRRGSWTVSPGRCASLRAKERRKAAEERKRKERKAKEKAKARET